MDAKQIGEKLRILRGKRSLEEVACAIGITASAMSNYENGIRIPRDDIKVKIAEYYKRSVKTIFFSQETNKMLVTKQEPK